MGLLDLFRRQPSELDRTREQLELAETRTRLAVVEAQERLVKESISSNDPRWRSSWEQSPDRQHTPTDTQLFPILDKSSEEGLAAIWQQSRDLAETNPFAIGALDNLENFIVGDGNQYTASTKDDAGEELVAAVQDVLDEFSERTIWPEWELELVRRRSRDGEYFLRFFAQAGRLDVRIVEPEWVKNPDSANPDEWQHGCKLDTDDKGGEPLAYWVVYPGEAGEEIPASEIQHVKANVDRNAMRGIPDLFATASTMDSVGRLLRNMCEGETIRAAIAGFWEYENATAAQVATHVGAIKDQIQPRATDPITGKLSNFQRIDPGTFIHVPKGKKYLPPPASPASTQQVEIEQAGLRSIAVRWNFPEYMISGDASNASYSSTLVSGAPFSRAVRKAQGVFKRRHSKVMWLAVEVAAKAGLIRVGNAAVGWPQVEASIEIQVEAHAPEITNELELSQVDAGDLAAGVMSKQTRAMRRGLDWEQEKKNLAEEPKPEPPPAPGVMPAPAPSVNVPVNVSAPAAPDNSRQLESLQGVVQRLVDEGRDRQAVVGAASTIVNQHISDTLAEQTAAIQEAVSGLKNAPEPPPPAPPPEPSPNAAEIVREALAGMADVVKSLPQPVVHVDAKGPSQRELQYDPVTKRITGWKDN